MSCEVHLLAGAVHENVDTLDTQRFSCWKSLAPVVSSSRDSRLVAMAILPVVRSNGAWIWEPRAGVSLGYHHNDVLDYFTLKTVAHPGSPRWQPTAYLSAKEKADRDRVELLKTENPFGAEQDLRDGSHLAEALLRSLAGVGLMKLEEGVAAMFAPNKQHAAAPAIIDLIRQRIAWMGIEAIGGEDILKTGRGVLTSKPSCGYLIPEESLSWAQVTHTLLC